MSPKQQTEIKAVTTQKFGTDIRKRSSEQEATEDIITAAKIIAEKRIKEFSGEDPVSLEDMEWALSVLCILPLWPKPDENSDNEAERREARLRNKIREIIVEDAASKDELPVVIPGEVFRAEQPSVLELKIHTSEVDIQTIREIIRQSSLHNATQIINNKKLDHPRFEAKANCTHESTI